MLFHFLLQLVVFLKKNFPNFAFLHFLKIERSSSASSDKLGILEQKK